MAASTVQDVPIFQVLEDIAGTPVRIPKGTIKGTSAMKKQPKG
jgi:hypothetical protein